MDSVKLNVPGVMETDYGLDIGQLDKAGFEELARKIQTVEVVTKFWIGDAANAVKESLGLEGLREWIDELGLERKYVYKLGRIAARYSPARRQNIYEEFPVVTFAFFEAAYHSPTPLEQALSEGIKSLSDLKKWVKQERSKSS